MPQDFSTLMEVSVFISTNAANIAGAVITPCGSRCGSESLRLSASSKNCLVVGSLARIARTGTLGKVVGLRTINL